MRWIAISSFVCACLCVSFAFADDDLQGPTKETFDKGVAAYDAGRYEEAFNIFKSIDDQNLAAIRNVALMERCGLGTPKNPKKAEEEYQLAAEAGFPTAQADLGEMLMLGEAGKPDMKAAAQWLALAVQAHDAAAEYELATLYETGQGVPKDPDVARQLYTMAAEHDVPGAKERLAGKPAPPLATACDAILAKARHSP